MSKCDICGEDSIIRLGGGKRDDVINYCQTCFNSMMADSIGIDAPENVPEELMIMDAEGKPHRFKIEYIIWRHMQRLEAYEDYSSGYRCAVGAEFDVSFPELWDRMMKKLERKLNTKYIDDNGHWTYRKIIGDVESASGFNEVNIVVDGKPYKWEELYREAQASEGWQIKIEFADLTEDLE
jgi:hypothetical protein